MSTAKERALQRELASVRNFARRLMRQRTLLIAASGQFLSAVEMALDFQVPRQFKRKNKLARLDAALHAARKGVKP